ncbi:hypothetical protein BDQ17DRAFT_1363920, partial [Cyathus striatus]
MTEKYNFIYEMSTFEYSLAHCSNRRQDRLSWGFLYSGSTYRFIYDYSPEIHKIEPSQLALENS